MVKQTCSKHLRRRWQATNLHCRTRSAQDFNIGGSLAGELGLSTESGRYTTVQDIDVTTVGGSQNAVGIIDAALKYVDSQRADLVRSKTV